MVSEAARENGHLSAELEAAESGWLIAKAKASLVDALSNLADAHILDEKIADAKHAVDIANRGDFVVEGKRESQSLWLQQRPREKYAQQYSTRNTWSLKNIA